MMPLRVLDLSSGIGGFSLGLERTGGFKTAAVCEISADRQADLARNFPGVPIYGDVKELNASRLTADGVGPINVLCAGFPCQDLSTSGTGAGLRGDRSGLWSEVPRLAGELGCQFIVLENSTELLAGWIGEILGTLASLGYDAEWECVPASATGAPHRRDRIIIIAYPVGFRLPGQGGLLNAIHTTPDAYREASGIVGAFQGNALPFVCGRHDGLPKGLVESGLHGLGNAVVPPLAEQIGNAILASLAREAA